MHTKALWTLGLLAAAFAATAASCTDRFEGCDKTLTCNDASGGQGGAAGGQGGAGGTVNECGPCTPDQKGCHEGVCVECTANAHCAPELCNPSSHTCVQCLENADCPATTPVCDGGTCKGCTEPADCTGRTGTELCHEDSGACVECLPGEHDSCGAGKLCHGEERQCVDAVAGEATPCTPCVADAHCQTGLRCARPDRFGEEGFFCLPEPGAGCDTKRPFFQQLTGIGLIDGGQASVCGHRFTSCAGLSHFSETTDGCAEADDVTTGDGACGLAGTTDNTRCRSTGANAACTFRCQTINDCPCGFGCTSQVCSFAFDDAHDCL